jgi:hypothetical protein
LEGEGNIEYQIIGVSGYRVDPPSLKLRGTSQEGGGGLKKKVYLVTTLAQEEPEEYDWEVVREWPKISNKEWLRVWGSGEGV